MPSISCSGIGAISLLNETMLTTPEQVRIGSRLSGSKRAKQ
jgi:hypothetical protein